MLGPKCKDCKLFEGCRSPFMSGDGGDDPLVIFVGEGPGAEEDKLDRFFVGRSGRLLRKAVNALGLDEDEVRYENIVRCRPPNNRNPKAIEIDACLDHLVDVIDRCDPLVVVLLGNVPMKAVLGQTGITQWNGVVVERDGRFYLPALHPSYVLRNNTKETMDEWLTALAKVVDIVEGKDDTPIRADSHYTYHYPEYIRELEEMADRLIAAEVISFDTECSWKESRKPGNKILSVSFGTRDEAWSFPVDHDEAWWDDDERDALGSILERILTRCSVVGHNVRFDCKMTRHLLGIEFEPWGDSMVVSQLLDTRKGIHGLKRLAGQHLGMFDYDLELQEWVAGHPECDYDQGGTYANVPLDVLLPYGGLDAAATYMLHETLVPELSDKQRALYEDMMMPADYVLGRMESNGILTDDRVARRYKHVYAMAQEKYADLIMADPDVKAYVRARRTGRVGKRMERRFAKIWGRAKKMPGFARQVVDGETVPNPKFALNINSHEQMADVMYVYKGWEPYIWTKTKRPSTAAEVIKAFKNKDPEFYENYRRHQLLLSMQSKYLDNVAEGKWDRGDKSGKVETNYNIGGAITGRISSSRPNLQNIPTPEKEPGTLLAYMPIKNLFTHSFPGGCLCNVDYSSMEVRIIASISGCQGLIDAFAEGRCPHCYVTRMVYKDVIPWDTPDDIVKSRFKEYRYKAKWTNWTLLYGGGKHTLVSMYGLSPEEADWIIDTYYDEFPEILDYQDKTIDFLERNGYIVSPLGRIINLPHIWDNDPRRRAKAKRTAMNMPIQGTASDILLMAMVPIQYYMDEMRMRTLMANVVHDSILGDVYPGELPQFVELCTDVMVNIKGYVADFMPQIDLSWLTVPLRADVEVGSHYGTLEHYHA